MSAETKKATKPQNEIHLTEEHLLRLKNIRLQAELAQSRQQTSISQMKTLEVQFTLCRQESEKMQAEQQRCRQQEQVLLKKLGSSYDADLTRYDIDYENGKGRLKAPRAVGKENGQ